jgi:TPR repeat protein
LLEDDVNSGHGRLLVALVLLVILGALGRWQVKRMGGIDGALTNLKQLRATSQAPTNPAPQQPQAAVSGPAAETNNPAEASNTPPASSPAASDSKANPETPSAPAADTNDKDKHLVGGSPASSHPAEPPSAAKEPTAKQPVPETENQAPDNRVALGEQYLYGKGVHANCGRALSLLRAAADGADPKAQSLLGTMYATGHCVPRDLPASYHYFDSAMRQQPNNRLIAKDLLAVWDEMSPAERQAVTRAPR